MPSPAARFAAEGFASAGLVLGAIDAPALLALVTAIAQRHGHAQTAGNEPWAQIDDAASRVTLALRIGRAPVFPSTAD